MINKVTELKQINSNNNDVSNNFAQPLDEKQLQLLNQLLKRLMDNAIKFQSKLKDAELMMKWNSELKEKCWQQKVVIKECKNRIGTLTDDIVDLQLQNKQQQSIFANPNNEGLLFSLCKMTIANHHGNRAHKWWGTEVVFIIIQLLAVNTKPTAIQSSLQIFKYLYTGKDTRLINSINFN